MIAQLPPLDIPTDPGRLTPVDPNDVALAIQQNAAVNAWWLVILLVIGTLFLIIVLTRAAWTHWASTLKAAWIFHQICRKNGLTTSDAWQLWRAGRGQPIEMRLALLLSRGLMHKLADQRLARHASDRLLGPDTPAATAPAA
ncbi:hypothetical protein [Mucisphaera sp.]|uniref:hypothetical protein n=1 Tax=Mucisphaera sp. TaxID=2913024 RepID=UPI003D0D78EB